MIFTPKGPGARFEARHSRPSGAGETITAPRPVRREFVLFESPDRIRVRRKRYALSRLADNLLFILIFALLGGVIFILYSFGGGSIEPRAERGMMDMTLEVLTIGWLVLLAVYILYFVLKMFNVLDRPRWVEVRDDRIRIGRRRFDGRSGRFQIGGLARPGVPEPKTAGGPFRLFPARIYLFYEGGRRIDTSLRSRNLQALEAIEDRLNRRLAEPQAG